MKVPPQKVDGKSPSDGGHISGTLDVAVELEQTQQRPGSPDALAREILFTGVEPDPLVLETNGLKLKKTSWFLALYRDEGACCESKDKRYRMENGNWCVLKR